MKSLLCLSLFSLLLVPAAFAADVDPYLGRWAVDLNGGAGWIEVTQQPGYLDGSVLWGGGSVLPVDSVFFDNGKVYMTRNSNVERAEGKRVQVFTDVIELTVNGDDLSVKHLSPRRDGTCVDVGTFTGKRIPALPAAPDLSKVKFGKAIKLFNGKDLNGWTLTNPGQVNGWSVQDGVLVNDPVQKEGEKHISYGNLRTEQEFEDFNLALEVNVREKGNSGIYLRGIYEVQVADTYGKPLDAHNMGGIYSRIKPAMAAEKPAGEWQKYDITLVDRHVTVRLNGMTIIDNQPLQGCTGGALTSDEFKPGPIYLQGDHTAVSYRNIVIRPVKK